MSRLFSLILLTALMLFSIVYTAPTQNGQISPIASSEDTCNLRVKGVCLEDWTDEERIQFLNESKI